MKALLAFLFEVYDFFVGDWRLLLGTSISLAVVIFLSQPTSKEALSAWMGWIFAGGLSITLVATVLLQKRRK